MGEKSRVCEPGGMIIIFGDPVEKRERRDRKLKRPANIWWLLDDQVA